MRAGVVPRGSSALKLALSSHVGAASYCCFRQICRLTYCVLQPPSSLPLTPASSVHETGIESSGKNDLLFDGLITFHE